MEASTCMLPNLLRSMICISINGRRNSGTFLLSFSELVESKLIGEKEKVFVFAKSLPTEIKLKFVFSD